MNQTKQHQESQGKIDVSVDVALFTIQSGRLSVGLTVREKAPFKDALALPGGYIHPESDKDAKDAAIRVLKEKTDVSSPYLEEFGTASGRLRDQRGWSLAVIFFALVPIQTFSSKVKITPVDEIPRLPFDHNYIIDRVVERIRSKASYSSLPMHLCNEQFTIPELHAVYETVMGRKQPMANFRRKLTDLGAIEQIGSRPTGKSRPAELYKIKQEFKNTLSVRERGF